MLYQLSYGHRHPSKTEVPLSREPPSNGAPFIDRLSVDVTRCERKKLPARGSGALVPWYKLRLAVPVHEFGE